MLLKRRIKSAGQLRLAVAIMFNQDPDAVAQSGSPYHVAQPMPLNINARVRNASRNGISRHSYPVGPTFVTDDGGGGEGHGGMAGNKRTVIRIRKVAPRAQKGSV